MTRSRISGPDRPLFLSAYCAVCGGLSSTVGTLGRSLVGYDLAHLLLLGEALSPEILPRRRSYCYLRLSNPLSVIEHRHPLAGFVSSLALTAACAWAADNSSDRGFSLKGLLAAAVLPALNCRLSKVSSHDFDALGLVESTVREQARLEAMPPEEWNGFPDGPAGVAMALAGPTAGFAAGVMATLGHRAGITEPCVFRAVEDLGRVVGGVIYLWDAVVDYDRDLASGRFNPGILTSQMANGGRSMVESTLRREASRAVSIFDTLPLERHRNFFARAIARIFTPAGIALSVANQVTNASAEAGGRDPRSNLVTGSGAGRAS